MSVGFLMPYFNVLLAHDGYKAWHIGIISALRPMVSTVSGPILSGVADRLAAHREVFLTTLVLSVAVRSTAAMPTAHVDTASITALLRPCYNAGSS
jgi:MFS_1 like family